MLRDTEALYLMLPARGLFLRNFLFREICRDIRAAFKIPWVVDLVIAREKEFIAHSVFPVH